MRRSLLLTACLLATAFFAPAAGWVKMFDGKSLDGWKPTERPDNWAVEEGVITGKGERSHLFWMKEECVNCEFKAKVWLNKGGNSGMYFRAQFGAGWPNGYESQVNNSHSDPVKTGSLYNIVKFYDQVVPDETWWEQHIIVRGNHIIIKVNGKTIVDFKDYKNTHAKGYLALQQHDPGSRVKYKELMYRKLD
jgi:hypothetical protein